jgi:MSHA pilin protein MshA
MRTRNQGFTMIELIVVIVILGVLAATALPKFIDLNSDAKAAALKGVAGAAASAMTINYSGCAVAQHSATAGKCVKVDDCNDLGSIMQGGLPTGYTVGTAALGTGNAGSNGVEATCTITQTISGATATATITGISAGNGP